MGTLSGLRRVKRIADMAQLREIKIAFNVYHGD